MTIEGRFQKLLFATPQQLAGIDALLNGTAMPEATNVKLYSISQAARETGMSRATIHRMINSGNLSTVTLRENSRRIPATELQRIARIA